MERRLRNQGLALVKVLSYDVKRRSPTCKTTLLGDALGEAVSSRSDMEAGTELCWSVLDIVAGLSAWQCRFGVDILVGR